MYFESVIGNDKEFKKVLIKAETITLALDIIFKSLPNEWKLFSIALSEISDILPQSEK
jgi:hypothetical protein